MRSAPAVAALLLAALLAGCGSSSPSSAGRQTSSSAADAAGSTGTTRSPSRTQAGGSSLKVQGTPKFAVPSKSDPVQSGTVQVAYRNITVRPNTLRVKAGTTVRWTNYDPVQHNVTRMGGPQRFGPHALGPGESFAIKLTRPGLVFYECTIHPATMNGSIEVL
jgi:plastocyanin